MMYRVRDMDPEYAKDVLGTMIVNCTTLQTTLTSGFVKAMDNPISLFQQPQQMNQQMNQNTSNTDPSDENIDESFVRVVKRKKEKRNGRKGKNNTSSKSRTKETVNSNDHESDDGTDDEVLPTSRAKTEKHKKNRKKAPKKQLREATDSGKVERRRKKEEERALRKERKDERRMKKLLRRLEALRDLEDEDYAPAQEAKDLNPGSDQEKEGSAAKVSKKSRSKKKTSAKKSRRVEKEVDNAEEGHTQEENATDLDTDHDNSRRRQKSRKKRPTNAQEKNSSNEGSPAAENQAEPAAKPQAADSETDSELEEPQRSASKMLKKLQTSRKKDRRHKKDVTRPSRKDKKSKRHISEELGENMAEDNIDVEDGSASQRQSQTGLGNVMGSQGVKHARTSKQNAKPTLVDAPSSYEQDASLAGSSPQRDSNPGKKRSRPQAQSIESSNKSAKKQKTDEADNARNPALVAAHEEIRDGSTAPNGQLMGSAQVRCQSAPASLVIRPRISRPTPSNIQMHPFLGQNHPITPSQQDKQPHGSQIKEESVDDDDDDDDDIQMFTSPTTPFKNDQGAANSEQPAPAQCQPANQNGPHPFTGVKVGQHTYFVSQSDNNTTRLSTPGGSRTLSLGMNTQAQRPTLTPQQQANPFQVLQRTPGDATQIQQPATPGNMSSSVNPSSSAKQKSSDKRRNTYRGKKNGLRTPNLKSSPGQKGGLKKRAAATAASSAAQQIATIDNLAAPAQPSTPTPQPQAGAVSPSQSQIARWTLDGELRFKCRFCGVWFKYSDNPVTACRPMHPGKTHLRGLTPRLARYY